MNVISDLKDYFSSSKLAFMKTVPFKELKFDPRAKYKCKYGCKNYGHKYSCPPESLKLQPNIQTDYKWAILFATTYQNPYQCTQYHLRALNIQRENEIQKISREVGNLLTSHGVPSFLLSGGSCKRCRECSIIEGEPCKKPQSQQVSMEAVGIDCQKTMHIAGFDFAMPDSSSINRCGCVLVNEEGLSELYLIGKISYQIYVQPTLESSRQMCTTLSLQFPHLYSNVELVPLSNIKKMQTAVCVKCGKVGTSFACPPYSDQIELNHWNHAIVWRWRPGTLRKTRYNIALKTLHSAFFSLGHYFSISLRDCQCDECISCGYLDIQNQMCFHRKLMAPSMQSQGLDFGQFGEGRCGIELI